jgi:hypothetical protein
MSDKQESNEERSNEIISLKSFKHPPSIEIPTWYKGTLSTLLATDDDTGEPST